RYIFRFLTRGGTLWLSQEGQWQASNGKFLSHFKPPSEASCSVISFSYQRVK
ncbi:hypothetical protein E2562_039547, partial [Oryza meyeriana var. granulata]